MLTVIRRAIRCGVLARRCSHVRWPDSDFSKQSTLARRDLRIAPLFYFGPTGGAFALGRLRSTSVRAATRGMKFFCATEVGLIADNSYLCRWDFETHQAMVRIEIQKHFEVGSGHSQTIVRLAAGAERTRRLHGNGTWRQFLRDENRKTLCTAFGPIVNARQHRILVIKIVVEHGDERRAKAHILLKRPRVLHLKRDFRHTVR